MRSEVFGYSIGYCRREGFECDFKRAQTESVNTRRKGWVVLDFCFLLSSVNAHTSLCHI